MSNKVFHGKVIAYKQEGKKTSKQIKNAKTIYNKYFLKGKLKFYSWRIPLLIGTVNIVLHSYSIPLSNFGGILFLYMCCIFNKSLYIITD